MFVKVYFFFLILNLSLFVIDGFLVQAESENAPNADVRLQFSPVHLNETGTLIFNSTDPTGDNSTLVGQLHFPANTTGDGGFFDIFDEDNAFQIITEGLNNFVKLFTGGFIFDVLDSFSESIGIDFPDEFIIAMNVIVGFITALFLIFVFFGRAFTSFT